MESEIKKIYQITSNTINTLVVENVDDNGNIVTGSAIKFQRATINTKANLTDITNPLAPLSLGGNFNLLVTAWESTTVNTGALDPIGVQVTGAGSIGVLFSRNWASGKTLAQTWSGGKMQVRSTVSSPAARVSISSVGIQVGSPSTVFGLKAIPNPTASLLNLKLESSNTTALVNIKVFDVLGKVIETRNDLVSG